MSPSEFMTAPLSEMNSRNYADLDNTAMHSRYNKQLIANTNDTGKKSMREGEGQKAQPQALLSLSHTARQGESQSIYLESAVLSSPPAVSTALPSRYSYSYTPPSLESLARTAELARQNKKVQQESCNSISQRHQQQYNYIRPDAAVNGKPWISSENESSSSHHANTYAKKRSSSNTTEKYQRAKKRKKMYSDFVGVTYNKTHAKYQACITHYRKQHYLGRYKLAVDAAKAYDESAKLLKGHGWKINFVEEGDYEREKKEEEARNMRISGGNLSGTKSAAIALKNAVTQYPSNQNKFKSQHATTPTSVSKCSSGRVNKFPRSVSIESSDSVDTIPANVLSYGQGKILYPHDSSPRTVTPISSVSSSPCDYSKVQSCTLEAASTLMALIGAHS